MDKKNLKEKKAEMETEFKDIFNRHRSQLIKVKASGTFAPHAVDATADVVIVWRPTKDCGDC